MNIKIQWEIKQKMWWGYTLMALDIHWKTSKLQQLKKCLIGAKKLSWRENLYWLIHLRLNTRDLMLGSEQLVSFRFGNSNLLWLICVFIVIPPDAVNVNIYEIYCAQNKKYFVNIWFGEVSWSLFWNITQLLLGDYSMFENTLNN